MSGATPQQPQQQPQQGFRDKRLDGYFPLIIQGCVALVLTIGAWQFSELTAEVRGLRQDLSSISNRVTVLESERLRERQEKLEERLRILELKVK